MTRQPDISFFITESKIISGAENAFVELANSFARKGLNVDFVMVRWPDNYGKNIYESVLDARIEIVYPGAKRLRQSIFKLAQYLKSRKPKVSISTLNYSNIVCILAYLLAGRIGKLFVRVANTSSVEAEQKNSKNKAVVLKFLYKFTKGVICPSMGVAEDLRKVYNVKNVITIPNPIPYDLQTKSQEPAEHKWLNNKALPLIVAGGRLCEQKNFSLLIKAFAKVRTKKDVNLIIMGEGADRNKLEQLIAELDLKENVDLIGQISNPFAFLAKSDLFVLSSIREGMPNMLLQALACGCPSVSTNCPSGPSELIKDGENGFLTPVGDEDKMAEKILTALDTNFDKDQIIASVSSHKIENISNQYLKTFGVL
ncbi:MAG: glycosyltransferase [Alphaproteobacteria bacterium]